MMIAALPPFHETTRQIDAILHSDELSRYIPAGDVLERIIKVDEGYVITTNKRQIFVFINYLPAEKIGPRPFTLDFVCDVDGVVGLDELDSADLT